MRKLFYSVVAAAAALSLAACSGGGNASNESGGESKGAVALSFAGLDITLWNDIIDIVEEDVTDAGYKFLTHDPRWDVQAQTRDWEAWANGEDLKALVAFPVQVDAVIPATETLVERGIPVMGYTTKWAGVDYAMVVHSYDDGFNAGVGAADWILEKYGDVAQTVAVHTDRNTDLGIERADGVIDGLKSKLSKVNIAELSGLSREEGQANTERQLTADPDTKIWLSTAEDNMLGNYVALMDHGVDPNDPDYFLGSMDVTNESITILTENEDSILRQAYIFAAQPLADAISTLLINAAEGKPLEDQVVLPELVTRDNAMDYWIE